jgi:hypothetical protein
VYGVSNSTSDTKCAGLPAWFIWSDSDCSLTWPPRFWSAYVCRSRSHIVTDGQSVSKSWCRAPFGAHDQIFIIVWQLRSCFLWAALSDERMGLFCICCWPLPAQSFSDSSPLVLATIFYCLRFETSLFVASYDSQGHGGGIRPRLHTVAYLCLPMSKMLSALK